IERVVRADSNPRSQAEERDAMLDEEIDDRRVGQAKPIARREGVQIFSDDGIGEPGAEFRHRVDKPLVRRSDPGTSDEAIWRVARRGSESVVRDDGRAEGVEERDVRVEIGARRGSDVRTADLETAPQIGAAAELQLSIT